jgi:hypothetical protein
VRGRIVAKVRLHLNDPPGQQLPAFAPEQDLAEQVSGDAPRVAVIETSWQRGQAAKRRTHNRRPRWRR